MALSAPGIGSNLDINSIVSQLMAVESRPLTLLGQREASFQARLTAYGTIKGALSSFQLAVKSLTLPSKFTGMQATSSDAEVLTGKASGSALAGTYDIAVSTLAQAQIQAATTKYAETDVALGVSGNLAFTVGANSFSVTVSATDTLEDIAAAINAADDNAGVKASIVNDGGSPGNRLVIAAADSGLANTVAIDDSGLSASFAFAETQPAQDLALTVNGIPVSKPSNVVTDAIQGVTLTVLKEGAATLTVAQDASGAKSAIDAFVKAYNDLNKILNDLSAYNAETKQAAVLQGEASVRTIQSQIRNALGSLVRGTDTYRTLSQLGISVQLDGSLSVDAAKLDSALAADPADIARFFTGSGEDGNPLGLATRLNSIAGSLLDGTGILASATDSINSSIREIGDRREVLNRRLLDVEERYRRQFAALDTLISSLNQTSAYLQQQLANLPTIGNN